MVEAEVAPEVVQAVDQGAAATGALEVGVHHEAQHRAPVGEEVDAPRHQQPHPDRPAVVLVDEHPQRVLARRHPGEVRIEGAADERRPEPAGRTRRSPRRR